MPLPSKLKPILQIEVDRLKELDELRVSDRVALKFRRERSAGIDRKLNHEREVLHLLKSKGSPKPGSLLFASFCVKRCTTQAFVYCRGG